MARLNPYNLSMEITRMFQQGNAFFALPKVQSWLQEREQDPGEYEILFHEEIAPPGSPDPMVIRIELLRVDGGEVDPWLQAEANSQG